MENERCSTPNCCKAVEMAASRSNMLQIARKTCRKIGSKKHETGKKNNSRPYLLINVYNVLHWLFYYVFGCCWVAVPLLLRFVPWMLGVYTWNVINPKKVGLHVNFRKGMWNKQQPRGEGV
jgi:hypothetical protein